jgi:murein DD-endopeptidase MepM/ murein hydrolase activator NlpD
MFKRFRFFTGLIVISAILAGPGLSAEGIVKKRYTSDKDMVDRQHAADLERIENIKKKLGAFKDDINRRLSTDNRTRIDDPVDIDNIDDIERIDHFHSRKKIAPSEFAFVNGERVVMRSEGSSKSAEVGRLNFLEKVEVIAQSERIDVIEKVEAPWVLVRRENGDEGWVFGAFLQKKEPDRKEDFSTFDREKKGRDFSVPLAGRITSRYGYRVHPVTKRRESFHCGLDIAAKEGTPVRASADGIVVKAEYLRNGYGKLVIIEHEKELSTYYGHLSEIGVVKGQKVRRGEIIGAVGRTGNATGAHLHFEVRRGGTACDPEAYLR